MNWISVKDSIPELWEKVLVCIKGKRAIGCTKSNYEWLIESWIDQIDFIYDSYNGYYQYIQKNVTHWQRFSEVPK